jgi:hypothetical protein
LLNLKEDISFSCHKNLAVECSDFARDERWEMFFVQSVDAVSIIARKAADKQICNELTRE